METRPKIRNFSALCEEFFKIKWNFQKFQGPKPGPTQKCAENAPIVLLICKSQSGILRPLVQIGHILRFLFLAILTNNICFELLQAHKFTITLTAEVKTDYKWGSTTLYLLMLYSNVVGIQNILYRCSITVIPLKVG